MGAERRGVLWFVCLLVVLGIYAGLRLMQAVVRALDLDPWGALVYLGLAEHELPALPRRAR